ncbi:MAG: hypothetical protein U5R14_14270 [Gemmatimonadota bacterium]|nr:hypothetical protein [Gemmatimonadota bacterium]
MAAPVFGKLDSPIGVLDLWTPLTHADPHQLALIAYAGVAIGFDLDGRRPGGILPRPERPTGESVRPPEDSVRDILPPDSEEQ